MGRLNIEHGITVQLGRVHFTHLILCTVLTTIDGRDDDRISVKAKPGQLAAIGQLKDTLTDLGGCTVYLIEKEYHSLITSGLEPRGRVPSGHSTIGARKAQQVTLGHL